MKPSNLQRAWRWRAAGTALAPAQSLPALVLVFALAVPLLWISLSAAAPLHVEVGEWGDHAYLTGVNAPERSSTESYRWTTGRAELALPNLSGRYRALRVRAHGWRPPGLPAPRMLIAADGHPIGAIQMGAQLQTYELLLPYDDWPPTRQITISSDAYTAADGRAIGVAIDWVELRPTDGPGGPAVWQLVGQALLLALALLLLGELLLPRRWAIAIGALLALAQAWANLAQPLWVGPALGAWALVLLGLLAATALARPAFVRALAAWMPHHQAALAWALFIGALALRLLGAVHPLFDMHDLPFHQGWLGDVTGGQLFIYSTPSEFQNRAVANPPAGYLLLMPLQLVLPSQRLAIQLGVTLADGLCGLMLLALARELGLRARAALLAAALYWSLPITMTMLWWGFATNALAQPAGLLLLWLLLRLARRPTLAGWAAFAAVCAGCLLLHIGATLLMLALLGATLALGWRQASLRGRWAALGAIGLALTFVGLVFFSAALDRPGAGADLAGMLARGWAGRDGRLGLIGQGLLRGYLAPPLALAPLGLLLALRSRRRAPLGPALLLGWLAVCLLFLSVYLGLGLVVRFTYFATPPICLGLGALLGALWARRGRVLALALLLLVGWSGAALWAAGVLLRVKPSALPLTY